MTDQKKFLNEIKQVVLLHDNKAQVILFGSRARGDNKMDSDWDLLLLTNKYPDNEFEDAIRDKIYDLELKYTQAVSTIMVNPREWKKMSITGFYENVIKEGIAL